MWIHRWSGEEGAFQAVEEESEEMEQAPSTGRQPPREGKEGQRVQQEAGWRTRVGPVRSRKASVASLRMAGSGAELCLAGESLAMVLEEERV